MKIPRGKLVKSYKVKGNLVRLLDEGITLVNSGYIRITEDKEGINDYYLFFDRGNIIGAYAEFEHGESIKGEEARKVAMNVENGIQIVYYLGSRILNFLIENEYPEVSIPIKSFDKNQVFIIAGVRIPLGEKKLVTIEEDCVNMISNLKNSGFTGYMRVIRETEGKVEDGVIVFLQGVPKIALLEHDGKTYKGDKAVEELLKKSCSKSTIEVWKLDKDQIEELLSVTKEATTSIFEIIRETREDRKALLKKYGIKEPDERTIKEILKYYSS